MRQGYRGFLSPVSSDAGFSSASAVTVLRCNLQNRGEYVTPPRNVTCRQQNRVASKPLTLDKLLFLVLIKW